MRIKNKCLFLTALSKNELDCYLTKYDVKRLEMYSKNLVDYHLIVDLIPAIAKMYFMNQMADVTMSAAQCVSKNPKIEYIKLTLRNISGHFIRYRPSTQNGR